MKNQILALTAISLLAITAQASVHTLRCTSDSDWTRQIEVMVVGQKVFSATFTDAAGGSVALTREEVRSLNFVPPSRIYSAFESFTCGK